MPLTKFKLSSIADGGITTAKLADDATTSAKLGHSLDLDGTHVRVPHGTTAERPGSPVAGYMRFNTTVGTLEQWNTNSNSWAAIDSPPIITGLAYAGGATAADPAGGETITITGSNITSGFNITVGGTAAASVTFTSSTTCTFVTPAKTAGEYEVKLTNPNGLSAALSNGISFNGVPTFSTAAGQLGSINIPDNAMSTVTIVAAEPDGGTLAYSVTTGALPSGLSLGSSNGQITGTPSGAGLTGTTTTNFTVRATDDESQTTDRAFNIQVYRRMQPYSITNSMINEKNVDSYLHKTPSGASNRRTFTFSTWIKLSTPPASSYFPRIFSASPATGQQTEIVFESNGRIRYEDRQSSGLKCLLDSIMVVHDTTGWGHIVVAVDITNSTQADRVKIYWNGVRVTDFNTNTQYSDTSTESFINSTELHRIGEGARYTGSRVGGYLAETHLIDGSQLAPTVFGESYNDSWVPKLVTGVTYGTNGFYMNYQTSSSLGDDVSGNTNDYAEAGVQYQSVDTPTNNFPTLNINKAKSTGIIVKEGGLWAHKGSARWLIGSNAMAAHSGKYYMEVQPITTASGGLSTGFSPNGWIPDPDTDGDLNFGGGMRFRAIKDSGTSYYQIGSGSSVTVSANLFSEGDWFGLGIDLDGNLFKAWKQDGTQIFSADISSLTAKEAGFTFGMGGESGAQSQTGRVNFGATSFNRTGGIPSGYQTFKFDQYPTLINNPVTDDGPQKKFSVATWTGNNASTRAITGLGFKPDIVWAKVRNASYQHMFMTSTIGTNKVGHTQSTSAFDNNFIYGYCSSFDSDGFTVQAGSTSIENLNELNKTYVGWGWKCGGAPTATNSASIGAVPTAGSVMIDGVASTDAVAGNMLTKKLSANTKSGVSTSIYLGNGGAGGQFAHGLGKVAEFVLHKRINASDGWLGCWMIGGQDPVSCNMTTSNPIASDSTYSSQQNTSTLSMANSSGARNTGSEDHFSMVVTSIPGMTSVGRYKGNGSVAPQGTMVELGFRPAFVMIKCATSGQWWAIHDSARDNGYNRIDERLFPNGDSASDTNGELEFHATGFKFYSGTENIDDAYHYYVAFADQPALFANAALNNI